MVKGSKPYGDYILFIKADNLGEAAKKAMSKLCVIGFMSGYNDVWSATITDPADKISYPLLQNGDWEFDKEGKFLEKRVVEESV